MASYIERPRFTCALGGAIAAVTAVDRAVPIVHGPPGCAGNLAWTQAGGCGLQVGGYCGGLSAPGSNIQEREVVFGGGERLAEQVANTLQVMDGALYIVLTSCVTEMIGDDVGAIVLPLAEQGVPIVYAETGGFRGNSYHGYELVLESLLKNFAPAGGERRRGQVNLWGVAPNFDVFWRGNLLGLRRLLARLGLSVNTFFTVDDRLEDIRRAGSAELNIVVSDVYGCRAAQTAEEIHGTPYITTALPIGPTASSAFLRDVGAALQLDPAAVEKVVAEENGRFYRQIEPLTDCFNDMDLQRYAAVVGDANYAPAITRFLSEDLGWLPAAVAVTDPLDEDQQARLTARLAVPLAGGPPKIVFSGDTSVIRREIAGYWQSRACGGKYANPLTPAFVVGSSLERELANDLKAGHLSVSFPVANRAVLDRGYTGFDGGLRLIEDLISAIIPAR
jgi:nitrogenase molybdenum-iron protein beta chain